MAHTLLVTRSFSYPTIAIRSGSTTGVHRMRATIRAIAAISLVLHVFPAEAQFTPFLATRARPGLSAADFDLLRESIDRLNREANVAVGSEEQWSNPATGSHGRSVVTRLFTSNQRPCHVLHHDLFPRGVERPDKYDFTWCRVADGSWKIKK
jgi:hypothetical protein